MNTCSIFHRGWEIISQARQVPIKNSNPRDYNRRFRSLVTLRKLNGLLDAHIVSHHNVPTHANMPSSAVQAIRVGIQFGIDLVDEKLLPAAA